MTRGRSAPRSDKATLRICVCIRQCGSREKGDKLRDRRYLETMRLFQNGEMLTRIPAFGSLADSVE
jgi:hypothetical protein